MGAAFNIITVSKRITTPYIICNQMSRFLLLLQLPIQVLKPLTQIPFCRLHRRESSKKHAKYKHKANYERITIGKGKPRVLTAKASCTCSNCFETVATAFAMLCFVTNSTSESDQSCMLIRIHT